VAKCAAPGGGGCHSKAHTWPSSHLIPEFDQIVIVETMTLTCDDLSIVYIRSMHRTNIFNVDTLTESAAVIWGYEARAYPGIWIRFENSVFPRHDTRVKPSIVDGWEKFSVARLRASTDTDSVGRAFQDEAASRMRVFEIDDTKLDGDCFDAKSVSPISKFTARRVS
jgi:hypothetical protein